MEHDLTMANLKLKPSLSLPRPNVYVITFLPIADDKSEWSSSTEERDTFPEEVHDGRVSRLKTTATDIRLVGGNNMYEGRVEIKHNGQ